MERIADRHAMRGISSCFLSGPAWIYFRELPSLSGLVLFGRPDRTQAESLGAALELEFETHIGPHVFYVDARQLTGADPEAFERLVQVYQRNHALAAERYTALVLLVPPGLSGAIVAGFHGALPPPSLSTRLRTRPRRARVLV